MLAKAMQLTRQATVSPASRVCMAIGIAECQLSQATGSIDGGDRAQAVTLLAAAHAELCCPDLLADPDLGREYLESLQQSKQQVLTLLCKTQLELGDGAAALGSLEYMPYVCDPWPTREGLSMIMEALVMAGKIAEVSPIKLTCSG